MGAYSDLSRPPLREPPLRRALVAPGSLWHSIRIVAETGSTNADAVAAAQAAEPEGLVIVAESQSAGRGRLDRQWVAPPQSSIMVSVLLRPDFPATRWGWLPLLAGVAVVEAVGGIAVVDARLKWPNDVLIRSAGLRPPVDDPMWGYGKGAGILAEAVPEVAAVVLGIGLNVSQGADELPEPVLGGFAPTSLALVGAVRTDRDPLLRGILRSIADWYRRLGEARGDPDASGLRTAYLGLCTTVGSEVVVALPGGESVTGRVSDVDSEGRLGVATPAGLRSLAAGDVQHVRATGN
jgi:BirA family biotin operon repressor/biotin-[acetyl-CoA-carboxylase] ligase